MKVSIIPKGLIFRLYKNSPIQKNTFDPNECPFLLVISYSIYCLVLLVPPAGESKINLVTLEGYF
jgi:hypothetical protein